MQYLNNAFLLIAMLLISLGGCSADDSTQRRRPDTQTLEALREIGRSIDSTSDSRIRFQKALDFSELLRSKMEKYVFSREEISLALRTADTDRSSPSLRKAVDVDAFTPAELLCLFSGAGMLKYVAVNVSLHFYFPYSFEVANKESGTSSLSDPKLAEYALRVAWVDEMQVADCTFISLVEKIETSMTRQFEEMGLPPYKICFVDSAGKKVAPDDKRVLARFTLKFPFPSGSIKASLDLFSIMTGCKQQIAADREIRLMLPECLTFDVEKVNSIEHLNLPY
jgi:hypothetical protein